MNFKEEAAALQPYIAERRRWLHQHPELTFQEKNTTGYIESELKAMGIPAERFPEFYGVMGTVTGRKPGKTVLLRADIDALGIMEENDLPFRSRNTGVMHACGHDCHTGMLLGAAKILQAHKAELAGTVKLLFQAAEESGHGADYYTENGYIDGVDAAFALHMMNELPEGIFSIEAGPRMSSCTNFALTVHGTSAHGSTPHLGKDAIVAASAVIMNLQTLVSRENNPLHPLVVTIGSVKAGKQFNIICNKVEMTGTIRTFDPETFAAMPERLAKLAAVTAEALGCTVTFDVDTREPAAVNDHAGLTEIARHAAIKLYGSDNLAPMKQKMGSEDFAVIMNKVPAVLGFLGYHNEACGAVYPLHSKDFYVNDAVLHKGSALYAQFAYDYLHGKEDGADA